MKKTRWFSADVKPVRVGLYECRRYRNSAEILLWNGKDWSYPWGQVWACMTIESGDKWRGLAEPPK
jgi:hypothetical protein